MAQPQSENNDDNLISIDRHRRECALRRLDCLAEASDEVIEAIVPHVDLRAYLSGDSVIASGQFNGSSLYGLIDGKANLTKTAVETGDIDIHEIGGGRTIGLSALLSGIGVGGADISLVAQTDLDVLVIDAEAFRTMVEERHDLAHTLLTYCAQELVRMRSPGMMRIGPERRVFRHLLSLVRRQGETFSIPEMPRHAVLAEASGVGDRVAASAVATLITRNIAKRSYPSLEILDIEKLRHIAY